MVGGLESCVEINVVADLDLNMDKVDEVIRNSGSVVCVFFASSTMTTGFGHRRAAIFGSGDIKVGCGADRAGRSASQIDSTLFVVPDMVE